MEVEIRIFEGSESFWVEILDAVHYLDRFLSGQPESRHVGETYVTSSEHIGVSMPTFNLRDEQLQLRLHLSPRMNAECGRICECQPIPRIQCGSSSHKRRSQLKVERWN